MAETNIEELNNLYKKKKKLSSLFYFLSITFAGVAFGLMFLEFMDGDSDFLKQNAYEHAFSPILYNGVEFYEHAYLVSAIVALGVFALFSLITLLYNLVKKHLDSNYIVPQKSITLTIVYNRIISVFWLLVALYMFSIFLFYRLILFQDRFQVSVVAGIIAGVSVLSVVSYVFGDYIHTEGLVKFYSKNKHDSRLAKDKDKASDEPKVVANISNKVKFEKDIQGSAFKEEDKQALEEFKKQEDVEETEDKKEMQKLLKERKKEEKEEKKKQEEIKKDNEKNEEIENKEDKKEELKEELKDESKEEKKAEEKENEVEEPVKEEQEEVQSKEEKEEETVNEEDEDIEIVIPIESRIKKATMILNDDEEKNLTKDLLKRYFSQKYPNEVGSMEEKKPVKEGLPMADIYYYVAGKKGLPFAFVYTTNGCSLINLNIPDSLFHELKELGCSIEKCNYPKTKKPWSSIIVDSNITIKVLFEVLDVAFEKVKVKASLNDSD